MKKKDPNNLKYAIWIDQKKAIVASMDETGAISTESLLSSVDTRERFPGETTTKTRLFAQTLNEEKHVSNRLRNQLKAFLKEVIGRLSKVSLVIIMGPAETKYELHKEMEKKKSLSKARIEVKTTDKMKIQEIKNVLKERIKG